MDTNTNTDTYGVKSFADAVRGNSYPGRGIVAGVTRDGTKAVIAYFIMGRSANSRNRIFTEKDGSVYTEPYDASKLVDPSLIIYAAVRRRGDRLIVTNGDQTDTIYEGLAMGRSFYQSLETRSFEPDAPNYTPRISAELELGKASDFRYRMSILKSMDRDGSSCARYGYEFEPVAGLGHFIHTYECDGSPLPSFQGEPVRISIPDEIDEFADEIWTALDEDNKISLYLRYTELESGAEESRLINKYDQRQTDRGAVPVDEEALKGNDPVSGKRR